MNTWAIKEVVEVRIFQTYLKLNWINSKQIVLLFPHYKRNLANKYQFVNRVYSKTMTHITTLLLKTWPAIDRLKTPIYPAYKKGQLVVVYKCRYTQAKLNPWASVVELFREPVLIWVMSNQQTKIGQL